jgi:hypothetical protein
MRTPASRLGVDSSRWLTDGSVLVSGALDEAARGVLAIGATLRVEALHDAHRAYLAWHRERLFRGEGTGWNS